MEAVSRQRTIASSVTQAAPVVTDLADEDKRPWWKKPNLRKLYLCMMPACMGVEYTSGFDSSMMNGIQTIKPWDEYFSTPAGARLGIMTASYSLGCVVALPLVPWVNERFGRKKAIYFGSIIMMIGAILQGASQNFAMFVIARVILGYGIPFAIVAASSLIGELTHPRERPIMTSLFNVSWFIGAIIAAGVNLGTFDMPNNWSWRIPSYLQFVPSLTQLMFLPFIPESPRFLVANDNPEEAHRILTHYHAEGNPDSLLVTTEMAQIRATIAMELEAKQQSWSAFFTSSANRRRAVIALCVGVFSQWSGNNPLSFYLKKILVQVGIEDRRTQNIVNLGMVCWSLVNGTVMALVVRRFKRRQMYITSVMGMLCVYIALTVASSVYAREGGGASGIVTLVVIFCYSPFYNMGFNALTYTYLVEIFPFTLRPKGITMQQWWGRCATFVNTFVNPIGLDRITWRYYIFYDCWLVFEGICIYLLFPETGGRSLEELAFLFEGEAKMAEAQGRAAKEIQGVEDSQGTVVEVDGSVVKKDTNV